MLFKREEEKKKNDKVMSNEYLRVTSTYEYKGGVSKWKDLPLSVLQVGGYLHKPLPNKGGKCCG